jgi:outer membrane protein assembly factor BamB
MAFTLFNLKNFISYILCIFLLTTSIMGFLNIDTSSISRINSGIDEKYVKVAEFVPSDINSVPIYNSRAEQSRAPEDVKYWATFQFDYSNTGNTTSKAPATDNLLWKFKAKGEIYSSPAVVGNFVYFTTDQGLLYGVNRKTGEETWRFDLKHNSYGSPTVARGYVYVGTGTETQTTENFLYRIKADTGVEDENFRIQVLEGAITGAPLVLDPQGTTEDRVYYGTLKESIVYSQNFGTPVPQPEWSFPVPNPSDGGSDGIWSSLTYYNSDPAMILFSTNTESIEPDVSRGLFCLNAQDGTLRWKFPPKAVGYQLQTYASPTVFFDDYAQQGKALIGMGIASDPKEGKLYCLDIDTGTELWNFTTGAGDFGYGVCTSPVVFYDKILFGAGDGKFYALDLNGKKLWDFQTNNTANGIYSSPAVGGNKVYFGSEDNFFYCLNVENGSLIWKYDTSKDGPVGLYGVTSSPAIAYNQVYVGGCNGYLYCFGSISTAPPEISITNPKHNDILNGTVQITGTAFDDVGVNSIQIKIDNTSWLNITASNSWSHNWNTTSVSDGQHEIYARAFDDTGFTMANITVIVNNAGGEMLVQVTSHKDGQVVSGITKFIGTAYHSKGTISEVLINIDNSSWEMVNGTTSWFHFWDTTDFEDGSYLIHFKASDGFTNSSTLNLTVKVINYIDTNGAGIYPMFRSNQNRIGITGYKVPDEVTLSWKFETENQVESSPVFYNNRLYFGSDDYFVYCLDSKTGLEKWKYETGNQVRSSIAIAGQRIFIGSQDYHMYCLNAISGEFIWKYKANGAIDSSPLIVGNVLYFGSYDGVLYALNTSDGAELWKFNAGDEIWGSAAYNDGCIYFGALNGKLYCLWEANGTERWNFTVNQLASMFGIYGTPVISGDKLIFGSEDNFVYCLNTSTGARLWIFKTTGYVYSSAAVSGGKVFISSLESQNDGILYALPLSDPNQDGVITSSEIVWKFHTHDYDGGSSPLVSVTSGMVLIGSNDGSAGGTGKLYSLDADSGTEIWNFTTTGDIHSSPVAATNRVYIGSLDNYMYCLGLKSDPTDMQQIVISINTPANQVSAGLAIENITFKAFTGESEPVAQAWFTFSVTKGFLTDYYGTAFEDGSYSLSYIAPEPGKIKNNITITISVNASRFGYYNGSNSLEILVVPRSDPDNGDKNGGESDDDLTPEILKPKNINYLIMIIILIVLILIILALYITAKRRLRKLQQPQTSEKATKTSTGDKASTSEQPAKSAKTPSKVKAALAKPASKATKSKPAPKAQPATPVDPTAIIKTQLNGDVPKDPTPKDPTPKDPTPNDPTPRDPTVVMKK